MATLTEHDLSVGELAKKAYLNVDQRHELEQSIVATETMLNETRAGRVEGDVEAMEKHLSRERQMLHTGMPPQLDTQTKNKVFRKVQELEAKFTHALPTYEQMQIPSPNHIDWHVAWERQHQQDVLAWKTGLLMLDPDNSEPNFRNIARLRGNKVAGTDPRKYWQGFEAIKFAQTEQQILEDMIATMDDTAYMSFLQLKSANWSKKNILRKLDWSEPMYQAAESRYEQALLGLSEDEDSPTPRAAILQEPDVEEAEETEVVEEVEIAWPLPLIKACGISVNKFLGLAKITGTRFYQYKKTGNWPSDVRKKIEKTLQSLQNRQEKTEPVAVTEPVIDIVAEPIEA